MPNVMIFSFAREEDFNIHFLFFVLIDVDPDMSGYATNNDMTIDPSNYLFVDQVYVFGDSF
jgi:hypothetical protein